MITVYDVSGPDGPLTFRTLGAVRDWLAEHPSAEVTPRVVYITCPRHRGYERGNCPRCGTASSV